MRFSVFAAAFALVSTAAALPGHMHERNFLLPGSKDVNKCCCCDTTSFRRVCTTLSPGDTCYCILPKCPPKGTPADLVPV